jgi:hypothetical protein
MEATLGNCPDCGRQISLKAKVCPHCGCPKPFGIPVSELAVVKPALSAVKVFFGGIWVFIKTVFWCVLVVGFIRAFLHGLADGTDGFLLGLGFGLAQGGMIGGIVGFVRMIAYWVTGGPKSDIATTNMHPAIPPQLHPRAMPSPSIVFVVNDHGAIYGPYSMNELRNLHRGGSFSGKAMVAVQGSNDWQYLNTKISSFD